MAKETTTRRAAEQDPESCSHTGRTGADAADTGQMFVTELLRREGRVDEQVPLLRPTGMSRLVAMAAGVVLLFGAAAAGTVALSGPRTERAVPADTGPSAIAGADALRPDLITKSVGAGPPAVSQVPAATGDSDSPGTGATLNPPSPDSPTQPAPRTNRTAPDQDNRQPSSAAPAEPPSSGNGAWPRSDRSSQQDPAVRTVARFYESVAIDPQRAFGLLGPQLRGSGYTEFRKAWSGVDRVTVDTITREGANSVLVTAGLERTDGSVLHTVQRVLVTSGVQPQIIDVRLLSASRS